MADRIRLINAPDELIGPFGSSLPSPVKFYKMSTHAFAGNMLGPLVQHEGGSRSSRTPPVLLTIDQAGNKKTHSMLFDSLPPSFTANLSQNSSEFKCRGYPWFAEGAEAVSTRVMLLNMLRVLEVHGFRLYASIDQNTGVRISFLNYTYGLIYLAFD